MEYVSGGGENFIKNHTEFRACFPENSENGEFVYVIGIEVKDRCEVSNEYHICVIPEAFVRGIFLSASQQGKFFKRNPGYMEVYLFRMIP
jgi:hypothetical protein